jgi:hypothetical protein
MGRPWVTRFYESAALKKPLATELARLGGEMKVGIAMFRNDYETYRAFGG